MEPERTNSIQPDFDDLDLRIEEVSSSSHHIDDCLSTLACFSCSSATAASLSTLGSIISCGDGPEYPTP